MKNIELKGVILSFKITHKNEDYEVLYDLKDQQLLSIYNLHKVDHLEGYKNWKEIIPEVKKTIGTQYLPLISYIKSMNL